MEALLLPLLGLLLGDGKHKRCNLVTLRFTLEKVSSLRMRTTNACSTFHISTPHCSWHVYLNNVSVKIRISTDITPLL